MHRLTRRSPLRARAAFVLLALATACASSNQAALLDQLTFAAAADPTPQLQPGDVVRITVWRQPELTGEFAVGPDSSIAHPLYQAVKVAGVPVRVAEQRIRDFLAKYETNPQVVVEPLFSVAVGGEVQKPDLYPLPQQTTIAQAIALAGGPTDQGRLDKVRLVRGGREVTADLTTPDAQWARVHVQSGDQIFVGRKHNILREYIGPLASMVAAAAAIVNAARR
jgi:polysaccharide export outer membrane protein